MVVFPPFITSKDVMELSLAPRLLAPETQECEDSLRKIIGQILTADLQVLSFIFCTRFYTVLGRLGRVGGTLISLDSVIIIGFF